MMLELPALETLRAKVASFGISDDSRIVVYFGKNGAVPSATRIIFTLDYLGLGARTSLLNGGLGAWSRAGQGVDDCGAGGRGRQADARGRPSRVVVDAEFVEGGRPAAEPHAGGRARRRVLHRHPADDGRQGRHIPGAVNIPFTEITDNKLLIDRARIEALFRKAGVKPGDTVVAYCHIGQQATAVIFAARLLGHPHGAL